ncbi:MAG: G5 domain-containing protein [Oscillospiraceae bacterium]|nr:G5 domain-containing protein [Oscillospiraceae bacterium]
MENTHGTFNTTPRFSGFITYIKQRFKITIVIFAILISVAGLVFLINYIESNTALGLKIIKNDIYMPRMSPNGYNRVFDRYTGMVDVTVIIVGGETYEITVPMITVGEIVSKYREEDYNAGRVEANVPASTVIQQNMTIHINEIDFIEVVRLSEIPFTTKTFDVHTIPKGETVTTKNGQNALTERTYRIKYVNGEFHSEEVIGETPINPEVPEQIHRGVGGTVMVKGVERKYSYYLDVTATAYGVDIGFGGGDEITYTGKKAQHGIIAVDPEMIELGSQVYIPGDEYIKDDIYKAEDAGSSIIGYRIDIWLGNDDLDAQIEFGRRSIRVYILETE